MFSIKSAYRDARRLKDIVTIAFKCGLGYYISRLKLTHFLLFHQKKGGNFKKPEDLALKLRMAMDELGGSFVKLGQLLSLRPDLIPEEYAEEFEKLQDDVSPFEFEKVKKIIEEDLKHKLGEIFSHFDKKPIASASIGQVHRAKLLSGEKVVVKVQRPDIEEKMSADIDLLHYLVDLVDKHFKDLQKYNLKDIVEEFERYTKEELDYYREARNIHRFYKNFENDETIKIPKVYWDFTNKRVLVMSFIDGVEIDDKEGMDELGCDNKIIAQNLSRFFLRQLFEFGFFHADPHPANVFILKGNKIALLDYGIVGSLSFDLKEKMNNFLISLVNKDIQRVVNSFMKLGMLEEYNNELEKDIEMLIEEYAGTTVEEVDIPHLFQELMFIATKYKFKLPVDFVLLMKATITCESVGQELDPEFNLSKALKEYVHEIEMEKLRPSNVVKNFIRNITDFRYVMKMLPRQTTDILDKLKRGELKVQFEHRDLKNLEKEIDRGSNRISMGVVIAALIVASAIVLQINQAKWMAVAGFGIALILSMMLTIDMIKERRVRV